MKAVTKEELTEAVERLNALPDGFEIVGSFIQTKYLVDGKEVARVSTDGFSTIYEII